MSLMANGIGSGLDVNGIIEQLMAVEQRPLQQLAVREGSYQAQLSAYGQIKSVLSGLQTSTNALRNANLFNSVQAKSGESAAYLATASSSASMGNYSIEVLQIAQGQRVVTNDSAAPSVGAGSLTINFGNYDYTDGEATGFNSTRSVTIDLEEGSTLESLRDAINGASGSNLRASVVDNGTAKQLIIAGTGEGAGAAFTLEGTGGLAGFSYDARDEAASSLTSLEAAQDAKLKVDGITLTRGSNTITNAIEGITINLLQASEKRSTLSVANDRAGALKAIESFVEAYNEVNTTLRSLTVYNQETQEAGILNGDATARSMQTQLRNALGAFTGSNANGNNGSAVRALSEMGISFERDGSLTINRVTLENKLNDPEAKVAEFFTGKDGVPGFAVDIASRLSSYVESGGLLDSRRGGINDSIRALDRQRETLFRRLEMVETRYRAEFTALDSMIANMMETSNFLQQQLANLPQINNNRK